MPLNEKNIFENVSLEVIKMKSGIMKIVNMKFLQKKSDKKKYRTIYIYIYILAKISMFVVRN